MSEVSLYRGCELTASVQLVNRPGQTRRLQREKSVYPEIKQKIIKTDTGHVSLTRNVDLMLVLATEVIRYQDLPRGSQFHG